LKAEAKKDVMGGAAPYLVGLDGGNLLVGRNGVADLLLPRLERAF